MYEGSKSCVRTHVGNTEFFEIEVGLHQGSVLSPFLFALIIYELSRGIQENIPWCLIFADDIVLVSESKNELNSRLEQWREALEQNGLRISRQKMEYLRCDFVRTEDEQNVGESISIGDQTLHPQESFRYLGSVLHKSGRIDEDVSHRIKVDMIPNGVFRENLGVRSITDKLREEQLRWYGHVMRRPHSAPVRRVEALTVDGVRIRGRPTCRWMDRLKLDMRELLLTEDMTSDRKAWRARIRIVE
ncbi:uncharacterized protein [Rutidosis leptorrhynchoides]|uniref:uncharacterized protein n=1 Tax=Rutidosis leptorrhynchoides TaxID=125765 RepID=UPI003A9959FA